jgi:membrane protein implicated in regulation of membrane protease activity
MTAEMLLAGLLCALALNAITAWIRLARPPVEPDIPRRGMLWRFTSAVLQTLALPLLFLLVVVKPDIFSSLLASTPYGSLIFAIAIPVLVLLMFWRLFVEFTRNFEAVRRQRAEAAVGRRVLLARRRRPR